MSSKRLLRLIGNIDDEFILNAAEYRPTKVRKLHTGLVISIVVSVACIAILISGVIKYVDYALDYHATAASKMQTHGIKSESVILMDDYFGSESESEINETWSSVGCISGIIIELRIDKINDSSIDVCYVINDNNYKGNNLYVFDSCFRILNEDQEDLIESQHHRIEDKVTLVSPETHVTMNLPDTCSSLEPGKYTLYGYVFNENGNYGYIAVEFMVP